MGSIGVFTTARSRPGRTPDVPQHTTWVASWSIGGPRARAHNRTQAELQAATHHSGVRASAEAKAEAVSHMRRRSRPRRRSMVSLAAVVVSLGPDLGLPVSGLTDRDERQAGLLPSPIYSLGKLAMRRLPMPVFRVFRGSMHGVGVGMLAVGVGGAATMSTWAGRATRMRLGGNLVLERCFFSFR